MSSFPSSSVMFSAEPPFSKSSSAVGEKEVSMPGVKTDPTDHSSSRFQNGPDQTSDT